MPRLGTEPARWRDEVRRIEDLGYSTVSISDHVAGGWAMDPFTVLTAAAEATSTLRLLTLVLGNDFRHPALVHKAVATLDVLSGGRVELGLGAGWMAADYGALGLPFDSASTRLKRLEESVDIIEGLFGAAPVTYRGDFYRVESLAGLPAPVQSPRPPLLIGGGGPVALDLAARRADIVGVHARLDRGIGPSAAADLSAGRIQAKVDLVRAAWQSAGRSVDGPEIQFSVYLCRVTGRSTATDVGGSLAVHLAADPTFAASSPAVLIGSVEECVDVLIERRERFGFSYLSLGPDIEAVAPIVARLAGQ